MWNVWLSFSSISGCNRWQVFSKWNQFFENFKIVFRFHCLKIVFMADSKCRGRKPGKQRVSMMNKKATISIPKLPVDNMNRIGYNVVLFKRCSSFVVMYLYPSDKTTIPVKLDFMPKTVSGLTERNTFFSTASHRRFARSISIVYRAGPAVAGVLGRFF